MKVFRLVVESYLQYSIFSIISILDSLEFGISNSSEEFSYVLSILLLLVVVISPPVLLIEACSTYNTMQREESKEVSNEDLAELKTDTRSTLQFYFYFVMRRLVLAITIVFCYSIPYVQCSILTFFISL